MKSYELKDFTLKFIDNQISILKKEGNFNAGVVTIEYNKIEEELKTYNFDVNLIKECIKKIENDGLINIITSTYYTVLIRPLFTFTEAIEYENGYYTTIHYEKMMNLELLASKLELLASDLGELKNNKLIPNETLTNIASVATIAEGLLGIFKQFKS
ncbi:hypothetical protein [Myroides odoratimimus]|uniref:hypothetical protein n=1 Tax=Myroides odoratimimus TaxID=76832 RepID=UPI002DB8F9A8|nr:hypothetical protein [Myroides odoratimimus]MEC4083555.1 hypothetical protein [Myroides odoratimimus]